MGNETLRDAAIRYARDLGWWVFPLAPRSKLPTRGSHGLLDATADPDQVAAWWAETPDANIGVNCGRSGLVVVDLDVRTGGATTWAALRARLGEGIDRTTASVTGSGGRHYIYRRNGKAVRSVDAALGPGVDVKAEGGYILLPPSIHPETRRPYAFVPGQSPFDLPPNPVPDALNALLPEYVDRRAKVPAGRPTTEATGEYWLDEALRKAAPGTRNATGFWLACQLRDAGIDQAGAEVLMDVYAAQVEALGDHRYTLDEAYASIDQAYATTPRDPARKSTSAPSPDLTPTYTDAVDLNAFALTETGDAEALTALYGDRLRFAHRPPAVGGGVRGLWLMWTGHRWAPTDGGELDAFAKATARARQAAALSLPEEKKKKPMAWAVGAESAYRRGVMVDLARSEAPIRARQPDFDRDPWLLGTENGVLDLTTGTLRPGRPADMVTRSVGYAFDPNARCPRWVTFLDEVFAGDRELVGFLQRAAGYALTGDTREQCLFLCHGSGANGKSVLLSTLRSVLGDYAANTPFSTFEWDRHSQATNDLAALATARLVTAAETSEARRLNESRVKAITGGDKVTARFLFSEFFDYVPGYKVWLAMNALPKVAGTDEGIWRRIRLIPFRVSFAGREDRTLDAKLRDELPGILAWAVAGCLDWQRAGSLRPPAAVLDATAAYRNESDVVGRFLSEATMRLPTGSVKASDLYGEYSKWCGDQGERPESGTAFGRRLTDLGYIRKHTRSGYYYEGLVLTWSGDEM